MSNLTIKCLFVAAALACSSGAIAGTVGTTMPVTATAVDSCAVTAQPLVFGTLNQVSGGATTSQADVTVVCTPGVCYQVGLDMGANAAGGTRNMRAAGGTGAVPYGLFRDSTRTTAWGNTVGSDTVSGTAAAAPGIHTVYGRVPAGASLVGAGTYTDTVTVTVTF